MLTIKQMLRIAADENGEGRDLLDEIDVDFFRNVGVIKAAKSKFRVAVLLVLLCSDNFKSRWLTDDLEGAKAKAIFRLIDELPEQEKQELEQEMGALSIDLGSMRKELDAASPKQDEEREEVAFRSLACKVSPFLQPMLSELDRVLSDERGADSEVLEFWDNLGELFFEWPENNRIKERADSFATEVVEYIDKAQDDLLEYGQDSSLLGLIVLTVLPYCRDKRLQQLLFACLSRAVEKNDISWLLSCQKELKKIPGSEFQAWFDVIHAAIAYVLLQPVERDGVITNAGLIGLLKAYIGAVLQDEDDTSTIVKQIAVSLRCAKGLISPNAEGFYLNELMDSLPFLLSRELADLVRSNDTAGFLSKVEMLLNAGQFGLLFKAVQNQNLQGSRYWLLHTLMKSIFRFTSFPELTRLIMFIATSMPRSELPGVFSDDIGQLNVAYLQSTISNPETTKVALAVLEKLDNASVVSVLQPQFVSNLLKKSMSLVAAYGYNPVDAASLFVSYLGSQSYVALAKAVYTTRSPNKDSYYRMLEFIVSKRKDLVLCDHIAQAALCLENMIQEYSDSRRNLKESDRKKLPVCKQLLQYIENIAKQVDAAGQKEVATQLLAYMHSECKPRKFNPLAIHFSSRWQDVMVRLNAIAGMEGRLGVDALSHFSQRQWFYYVHKAVNETDLSRLIDVEKDIIAIEDSDLQGHYLFDVKLAQWVVKLNQFAMSSELRLSPAVGEVIHAALSFFEDSAKVGEIDSAGLNKIKQLVMAIPGLCNSGADQEGAAEPALSNQALLAALNNLNHKLNQPWPEYPGICEPVLPHEDRFCVVPATGQRSSALSSVSLWSDDSTGSEQMRQIIATAKRNVRRRSGSSLDGMIDPAGAADTKGDEPLRGLHEVHDPLTPRKGGGADAPDSDQEDQEGREDHGGPRADF